jgi:hypothetical protein
MNINISNGELLDKLSILEIKIKNIKDPQKNQNIFKEYSHLKAFANEISIDPKIGSLYNDLLNINEVLWKIEDEIRECEKSKEFGKKFIELARNVYFTNDRRFEIKQEINKITNSDLIEEKSYTQYN